MLIPSLGYIWDISVKGCTLKSYLKCILVGEDLFVCSVASDQILKIIKGIKDVYSCINLLVDDDRIYINIPFIHMPSVETSVFARANIQPILSAENLSYIALQEKLSNYT